MLSAYYDKTATIKRLGFSDESGSTVDLYKQDYAEHIASVPCLVQPVDATITPDIEGGFGKDFLMMCDVADIKDSDRVVIDGDEYRIVGIEHHNFLGHSHLELLIRIFNT